MKIFRKHILTYISFGISVVFLLIALNFAGDISMRYDSELISKERTVILLDVSQSMNIRDIEGNRSRLDAAKDLIEGYIKSTHHQIGLSIFAGEGVNILPINGNHELSISTLKGLDYRSLHLQGSRIDTGLESSIALFGDIPGGNLIIFTDQDSYKGTRHITQLQDISRVLGTLDIQVTLVGVGTPEGGVLEIGRDFWGQPEYKTYKGEIVRAPLEEDYLREVSQVLGGRYINYRDFDTGDVIISGNRGTLNNISLTLTCIILSILFFLLSLGLLHKMNIKTVGKLFS